MTRSPLWREFESGESFLLRLLRLVILGGGLAFVLYAGVLEMAWRQQAILAGMTILMAMWMDRRSTSYVLTLTLMLLSCFSTLRYAWWRFSTVGHFFGDPGTRWSVLDACCILLLLAAECYAFVVMVLGYLQTIWPLRRAPVPLPESPEEWPEVDLLIPTFSEPLSVVRYTVLAAMNIDWPADKLNVYILDDGRREEFRAFAEEAGVGYMTREDNTNAKAGNVNRALKRLNAPFVAIFDSDHVPTRSFLQLAMGWFVRDAKLGMLQTPHHFYSPDPFERNLNQFRRVPNEGELFYGVVQDGNDFWNATLFCGSSAVMRRKALDEVGGLATETVTEDAHTSLRLQMHGWNTAYINIPQSAGLATERLSGHVKQRIRWARGMVQILRTDNPLFAPGLKIAQRLCYFNAMVHFLFALPRLVFLTAPLIYLVLGHTNLPGYWAAILAYGAPHLVLSWMANSRIQGQHRHSFWSEVHETVLAPYILFPTLMALISPKLGSFNVTAKGGVVSRTFFDRRTARPFVVLLAMNIVGLLCAIPRLVHFPTWSGTGAIADLVNLPASMYDGMHAGTVFVNIAWTLFNMVILGVATSVAWESRQLRTTVRVPMAVPVVLVLSDGTPVEGVTQDVSSGGTMLQTYSAAKLKPGDAIQLVFPVLDGDATLPATVVEADGQIVRTHFDPLTLQEEEALTMVLFSRADNWLGWGETLEADRPLHSFARLVKLAFLGLTQTARGMGNDRKDEPKGKLAHHLVTPLLVVLAALLAPREAHTSAPARPQPVNAVVKKAPGGAAKGGELKHGPAVVRPALVKKTVGAAGGKKVAALKRPAVVLVADGAQQMEGVGATSDVAVAVAVKRPFAGGAAVGAVKKPAMAAKNIGLAKAVAVAKTLGAAKALGPGKPVVLGKPVVAMKKLGQTATTQAVAKKTGLAAGQAGLAGAEEGVGQGHAPAPGTFDTVASFADVGLANAMVLRGVDSSHAIYFPVPQTQTVTTATMKLRYHASPGLLPAMSHLKVSLNGSLLATLPVKVAPAAASVQPSEEDAGLDKSTSPSVQTVVSGGKPDGLVEARMTLPGELLVHRNELTFEFIGHYTLDCEDPANSTLWLQVDPSSTIELAGRRTPMQNDLKLLPLPFYDSAVHLHPVIPVVFATQPSMKALQAAGIVASYFGVLTDMRPVQYPVTVGTIPSGNVMVISERNEDLPTSVAVSSSGPTVAIRTNPTDPYSKVLVITGDNADEMLAAARALTTQRDTLASDTQRLSYKAPGARQPDDAPRWMRTDAVTPLMDLARESELQADGSAPLHVYMRLPPDLYYGVKENVAMHLFYRYNGIPLGDESSLQMYMNGAYVGSAPLPHSEKSSGDMSTVVPVPVADMRPFSNSLMMQFAFKVAKKEKCEDTAPLNLRGSIGGDSYLDARGIAHWATLPNLEIFSNAGYPFTRMADLQDTAVVLPETPSTGEMEMFLAMMGHFGAQTGYPVVNVTVTTPDGMKSLNKDFLVMGTADDISGAIGLVNDALPVKFRNGGLQVQDMHGFFAALEHAWWRLRSSNNVESGKLETAGGLPDALVEGIEWPRGSNRSVVLIALRDRGVAANFVNLFLQTSQSSDISQSVSVLNGTKFSSYRMGNDLYHVGHLSWFLWVGLLFGTSPWLLVMVVMILCFLIAVLLRAMLRRQARRRLQDLSAA